MNIFGKILATTLPLVFFFLFLSVGTAYYFSRQALTELAETWLQTRLTEAMQAAADQHEILRTYGLEHIPASIAKAKLDAGTRISAIEVGQMGHIFAVTADGVVAMHPDRGQRGRSVQSEQWFQSMSPGPGRIRYMSGEGRHLAMYDYFKPWDWYILASDPEQEVYGVADRMKPYILYLVLFCGAAMALTLMWLTRRLTSPLRALTDGAERIGNGELDIRIAAGSRDEIGRLGDVFNHMTRQLRESHTALVQREEHFRTLIENATDLVTILDASGRIVYQSPASERILGYPPERLAGSDVMDFIHPDDAGSYRKALTTLVAAPDTWASLELRIRRSDGAWRTLESTSRNSLGHPAVRGIVVNSRDVTQRKLAEAELKEYQQALEHRVAERTAELLKANTRLREEIAERQAVETALRDSEQRLKAILQASPVGIGLVVHRRLEWANETLFRMLGYAPGALVGQNSEILYTDYDEYNRVGRVIYDDALGKEIAETATRLVRADGTVFDCIIRALPLSPGDSRQGAIVAIADVSEARRLETELQRAKKMEAVGTLAGGVAHDLNNILSGIVSYPELLLLDLPEGSPLRKPLETIRKSGERAAAIVQDLLTMARRGVAVVDVVDINKIVSEQVKSPECDHLLAVNPGVALKVHLTADLPPIKGSAAHLSKCIMNLLANAAEAMASGGAITIQTEPVTIDGAMGVYAGVQPGQYAAVSVTDTGVGISRGDQERIFEPFYTKKQMGRSGSGLGMAVVWGTVKDHSGHIHIDSAEGRGTTFTLYFPITRERPSAGAHAFRLETYRGNKERVLVVDDSQVQREIAERVLSKLNYTVSAVDSGEAAVTYLQQHRADIVVLDMIMPRGMDGLDTYRRILRDTPGQKAIIASGYSETERVRAAQKLGAGSYVRKPYAMETIGIAIKQALAADAGTAATAPSPDCPPTCH